MELVLKIVSPNGEISHRPFAGGRLEIEAAAGHRYELVATQTPAGQGPRIVRFGDDLIVQDLPGADELQVSDFFKACGDAGECRFSLWVDGQTSAVSITPASEPLAALTGGGFLMASANPAATTLPTAPEAESSFGWRPIAAGVGALGVLAIAGAGSGGGGSDAAAPTPPVVNNDSAINTPFPTFSGTAEPNSRISLTVSPSDGGPRIVYQSSVDANGNWSVNTATQTPSAGVMPAAGLPTTGSTKISVVALDAAGNISGVTDDSIALDVTAPAAPALETTGELAGPNGTGLALNRAELADGLLVRGSAEAGSTVTVRLLGNGADVSAATTADAQGQFVLQFAAAALPTVDGTYSLSANATDAAGNLGKATTVSVIIDRTVPTNAATITGASDDLPPTVGTLPTGSITNDTRPVLLGTLSAPLAADEQVIILRDGQAVGEAVTSGLTWSFVENMVIPDGSHTWVARVTDDGGNAGPGSAALSLLIDSVPPAQLAVITQILDDRLTVPLPIANGTVTRDDTPLLRITTDSVLAPGETMLVLRAAAGVVTLAGEATAARGDVTGQNFEFLDSPLVPNLSYTYQVQVRDGAGQLGLASGGYSIGLLPDRGSDNVF